MRNAIVYNSNFSNRPSRLNHLATLLAAVSPLKRRHVAVLQHNRDANRARVLSTNLMSLSLATAFLESAAAPSDRPVQVAVIGPTQAGKSTVVNALLGDDRAGVSPLAGYTVHPQAFPLNVAESELKWLDDYFAGYQRYRPEDLPADRYDAFAQAETLEIANHPLPACVLWDTPDFDSVDATAYRAGVLRTAALADAVLVVISKDKYADQSVWDTLGLLEPLGQPTLLCLNKTPRASRDTLIRSLAEKWRAVRRDDLPPVVALPYLDSEDADTRTDMDDGTLRLQRDLTQTIDAIDRSTAETSAIRLMRCHWDAWLAPVRAERDAGQTWHMLVDSVVQDALSLYARDYLERPRHYDTFQRALAELLTLLEIPGFAGALVSARKLVTWPVRQLMRLGSKSARSGDSDKESELLLHIIEHVLIRLGDAALDHSGDARAPHGWWRDIGQLLRERRPAAIERARRDIEVYTHAFRPEIEATAHQLYEHLREHPAILNSLRATRVFTDAAALAAALHTGGLGIHDFILAPAVLSLTSLLTESALGRYLHKAEAELKARQLEHVSRLFDTKLKQPLSKLPQDLPAEDRFNLPAEILEQAEALLAR